MLCITLLLLSAAAPQDVGAAARDLAARSELATHGQLGTSRGGRPLHLLTLADPGGPPLAQRPAVLVVAGAHGQHRIGTELALFHAEQLVDRAGEEGTRQLLREGVVYLIPQLNPDGAGLGRSGNAAALDLDRDGARDEDPHDDLDGDGQTAQMRWRDPEGGWIVDPDEPRLLREADPAKGERGAFRLAVEGLDNDGDGEVDEDPALGVQLHRSFSHAFPNFDRTAGAVPMGEPEARALADFVFAHRNIGMAFVYGVDDNLLGTPESDKGSRRAPLTGILDDDKALYEQVGALYRERTSREGEARDRHDGSVWSWLYCDVAVPAFATDVWRLPSPDAKAEDGAKSEAQVRLAACDAAGRGFVAWHAYDHPTHGAVELGGFVQQHDTALLPTAERAALFMAHHDVLLEVAGWRPRCRLADVRAEARGDGVFALSAAVVNDGRMAALSAIAARSRRFSTPRLELALDQGELVTGDPRPRLQNLDGLGGRAEQRWLLAAPAGTRVTLTLTTDFAGVEQQEVTL